MSNISIHELYKERKEKYLETIEKSLEQHLWDTLGEYPRIDRVGVRSKSIERFLAKAEKTTHKGTPKYTHPLSQIQDQLGARIVTFYKSDVDEISKKVKEFFRHVEEQKFIPDTPSEFGYEGRHFILFMPEDIITSPELKDNLPQFFELQIKSTENTE